MSGKAATPAPEKRRHAHWDKVVSAAYLRIIGESQKGTATSVGRSERTIWGWENDAELWAAAREEARHRWLREVTDASRRSVLKAAGRNADLAFRILERVDPDLAPKQKHEHSGPDGGPIQTEDVGLTDAERAARVLELLDRARARRDGRAPDGD